MSLEEAKKERTLLLSVLLFFPNSLVTIVHDYLHSFIELEFCKSHDIKSYTTNNYKFLEFSEYPIFVSKILLKEDKELLKGINPMRRHIFMYKKNMYIIEECLTFCILIHKITEEHKIIKNIVKIDGKSIVISCKIYKDHIFIGHVANGSEICVVNLITHSVIYTLKYLNWIREIKFKDNILYVLDLTNNIVGYALQNNFKIVFNYEHPDVIFDFFIIEQYFYICEHTNNNILQYSLETKKQVNSISVPIITHGVVNSICTKQKVFLLNIINSGTYIAEFNIKKLKL